MNHENGTYQKVITLLIVQIGPLGHIFVPIKKKDLYNHCTMVLIAFNAHVFVHLSLR